MDSGERAWHAVLMKMDSASRGAESVGAAVNEALI
jgi:hypothetical protein